MSFALTHLQLMVVAKAGMTSDLLVQLLRLEFMHLHACMFCCYLCHFACDVALQGNRSGVSVPPCQASVNCSALLMAHGVAMRVVS
jgi:hypothetical protein